MRVDLTGQKFGQIEVLGYAGRDKHGAAMWDVRCTCGKEYSARGRNLRRANVNQCGDCHTASLFKHGHKSGGRPSYLYTAWTGIVQRTTNPKNRRYADWGGRGIGVHEPWRTSFPAFCMYVQNTIGERPEGHSLDRRDNAKGYIPGNLRWATRTQQQSNLRTNRLIVYLGERMTVSEFSRRTGINRSTIYKRLRNGATLEEIVGKQVA